MFLRRLSGLRLVLLVRGLLVIILVRGMLISISKIVQLRLLFGVGLVRSVLRSLLSL